MTRKITPAQLDEIEAAAKKVTPGGWWVVALDPPDALALVAEVRELRAKVERVREVHEPIDAMLNPGRHERVVKVCIGCGTDDGNWQRWPCPTIRALDAN